MSDPIPLPDLRALLAAAERATPGPWHWVRASTDEPCNYDAPEPQAVDEAKFEVFFDV